MRQRVVNQRVAPCPLEVRASAAEVGPDGRLTYYASTQTPFTVREQLAKTIGMDESQVRVISPDVGGGFGAKAEPYPEELLSVGWPTGSNARCAGRRPVPRACWGSAMDGARSST